MFDRYFADQRPGWRRRALMGASIALHGLLAALVLSATWARVESAPVEVPLTFFAPPPPPPPAASPATKATSPRTKPRVTRPDRLVRRSQPIDKPAPQEQPADDQPAEPGGVAGGVPGGVAGGVVGGTGKPRDIPQFMANLEKLSAPDPHLPEWFRQQHPRQSVKGRYRVCVDNDGRVVTVEVEDGIPGVDALIRQQVLAGWRYKPQVRPFCAPNILRFDIN